MQPHPPLAGLHHVSLLARDLMRTVQFYTETLGLRILDVEAGDSPSTLDRVSLGTDRGAFIVVTKSAEAPPGQLGIGTIHHVAFGVSSRDALLKWKRWLQENQVLAYGPFDQQVYQDLVLTDPDGVLLELATAGPGFDVTRDGTDVYAPPKLSMAPYRDEEQIDIETWPQPVTEIDPDMDVLGLHHVATVSSSLARTDAFYREILGLPLVRKTIDSDDPEVERWYWGLDEGRPGTLIAAFPIVHPGRQSRPADGQVGPGVPSRFALDMGGPESLAAWVTSLAAAGLAETPVLAEAGRKALSLQDPDGLDLELVAAGR